jgi:hypothetical protein
MRALLVGCSRYPNLGERFQLGGPENDVELFAEVLRDRYEVPADRLEVLAGWPEAPDRRPTRANILAGLRRLAETARAGEQVIVFLAGHGSQQPANPDPSDDEPDGLDEIFLGADASRWDDSIGAVPGAITDDELGRVLGNIRRTGAEVSVFLDACHSGTATRGAPAKAVRWRNVDTHALLGDGGRAALQRARAEVGKGKAPTRGGHGFDVGSPGDGFVVLSAAQSREKAAELGLPEGTEQFHGLFTYLLCQVLSRSAGALTYRELAERVTAGMRGMGFSSQTPHVEGAGLDRHVFGSARPRPPRFLLGAATPAGGRELRAGALDGLTTGSILAVFPPAGESPGDAPLGHVRVRELGPRRSRVEPVAHADLPAPEASALVEGSRCRLVFVDYGDRRVPVALQTASPGGDVTETHPEGKGPLLLEAVLEDLAHGAQAMIRRSTEAAEARWFLRVVGDEVQLVPREGVHGGDGEPRPFVVGTSGMGADLATLQRRARTMLASAAKAENLLSVVSAQGESGSGSPGVRVRAEMLWYPESWDANPQAVTFGSAGRFVREGERVAFRIRNLGDIDADVTLLYLDAAYGITAMFPSSGEDNLVAAGKEKTLGHGTLTGDPLGTEHLVVLAVRHTGARQDFAHLAQPRLDRTRGETSPLAALLDSAVMGAGTTRGAPVRRKARDHDATILSWRTRPGSAAEASSALGAEPASPPGPGPGTGPSTPAPEEPRVTITVEAGFPASPLVIPTPASAARAAGESPTGSASSPAGSPPDPWALGANVGLANLDEDEAGVPDVLFASRDREPRQFLLDLDGDTDPGLLTASRAATLVTERRWDWEVAIHREPGGEVAFYDLDGDRRADRIHVDRDDDGRADTVFTQGEDGRWSSAEPSERTRVVAPALLQVRKLRKRLKMLAATLP